MYPSLSRHHERGAAASFTWVSHALACAVLLPNVGLQHTLVPIKCSIKAFRGVVAIRAHSQVGRHGLSRRTKCPFDSPPFCRCHGFFGNPGDSSDMHDVTTRNATPSSVGWANGFELICPNVRLEPELSSSVLRRSKIDYEAFPHRKCPNISPMPTSPCQFESSDEMCSCVLTLFSGASSSSVRYRQCAF